MLFAFLLKFSFSLDTFALIPFLFSFPATILFGRNQKSVRFLLMIVSSFNFYLSGPAGTQKAYAFSARFIKNARFLQNLTKRKYIARARNLELAKIPSTPAKIPSSNVNKKA